jgi:hypothetical protein
MIHRCPTPQSNPISQLSNGNPRQSRDRQLREPMLTDPNSNRSRSRSQNVQDVQPWLDGTTIVRTEAEMACEAQGGLYELWNSVVRGLQSRLPIPLKDQVGRTEGVPRELGVLQDYLY